MLGELEDSRKKGRPKMKWLDSTGAATGMMFVIRADSPAYYRHNRKIETIENLLTDKSVNIKIVLI